MDDRLLVSANVIDAANELANDIDQWAEDADGFGQHDFADDARRAAEAVRTVVDRFATSDFPSLLVAQ